MPHPWFYLSPLPREPQTVALESEQARHAAGARRLGRGDDIVLFDGAGGTAHAELLEVTRSGVQARLKSFEQHEPPRPRLHLASALPKGDRQATLLAMATQLGVSRFTPLRCTRAVALPTAAAQKRWPRICREACKQSRRPHLPELCSPLTPLEVIEAGSADVPALLLHPTGTAALEVLGESTLRETEEVQLLVGPEGGFDEREIAQALRSGARMVSLGESILRTETAALAALAIFGLLRSAGEPA